MNAVAVGVVVVAISTTPFVFFLIHNHKNGSFLPVATPVFG
jgi:hypothetical protein